MIWLVSPEITLVFNLHMLSTLFSWEQYGLVICVQLIRMDPLRPSLEYMAYLSLIESLGIFQKFFLTVHSTRVSAEWASSVCPSACQ